MRLRNWRRRIEVIASFSARRFSRGRVEMLPGEIEGLRSFFSVQDSFAKFTESAPESQASVFIFLEGRISANFAGVSRLLEAPFIAAIPPDVRLDFECLESARYIRMNIELSGHEMEICREKLCGGYFAEFKSCPSYSEAIKSAKTVSRTLLPDGLIPRFCMGSVETEGPDQVAAHSHPMLEQFFWGLKGNDCIVDADSDSAAFEEDMLLKIPSASMHGVRVLPGKRLSYLWLDFFRDEKDMSYIRESHKSLDGTICK